MSGGQVPPHERSATMHCLQTTGVCQHEHLVCVNGADPRNRATGTEKVIIMGDINIGWLDEQAKEEEWQRVVGSIPDDSGHRRANPGQLPPLRL